MQRTKLIEIIDELRRDGRELEGDGFGIVGDLKSAHKKACKALEELVALSDQAAVQQKAAAKELPTVANSLCLGQGAANLPHCTCRLVFLNSR